MFKLVIMNIGEEAVPLTLSKSTKLISLDPLQKRCVAALCSCAFPPAVSHKQFSYGSKEFLYPTIRKMTTFASVTGHLVYELFTGDIACN